jgi:hypothetical protein
MLENKSTNGSAGLKRKNSNVQENTVVKKVKKSG